jgi:hypothetical protein
MRKYYMIFILLVPILLPAVVWDIALDGSGDFSEIQTAIEIVENGDTLLIHPGTYYENLYIHNKDIHLWSLYVTTQDSSYIQETTIDGTHIDHTVYNGNGTGYFSMNGLRVVNGYCHQYQYDDRLMHGAGVLLRGGSNNISNCLIENNYSERTGGGIYVATGTLYLSGNIIRFNVAIEGGGGLAFGNDEVIFDETNLNSIYGNYGYYGSDILNRVTPDFDYYFPMRKGTSNPPNPLYFRNQSVEDMFNVSYEESYIAETAAVIYVSPEGDNANDGTTPETAVRNIWYATMKCEGTEENPGVIYLSPGIYSGSSNEEYPVTATKSNMNIIGSGSEITILDREGRSGVFGVVFNNNNYLEGFTVCNDSGEFFFPNFDFCGKSRTGTASVRDIVCQNIQGLPIMVGAYDEISFDEIKIYNTTYRGSAIQLSSIRTAIFRNLEIRGSRYQEVEDYWQYEGGFGIGVWNSANLQEPLNYYFENVLITDTDNRSPYQMYPTGSTYAIAGSGGYNNIFLVNTTISGNMTNNHYSCVLGALSGSQMNIYNSIIFDNQYHSLKIGGNSSSGPSYIGVTHSLVEGGFEDMITSGGNWQAEWFEGNLEINDSPEFCGVGLSEFMLQVDSPCIDSGTLAGLPGGFELSETDLAGNPRIYGAGIDMGCYEWQGTECDFSWEQEYNLVTFYPDSNEEIYDIGWDFECDEEIDSNELQPTHRYLETGTYSVGVYINGGRGGRKIENCLTIDSLDVAGENIPPVVLTSRNYPNPFNPRTTIEFTLPAKGETKLAIYDVKGRKVKILLNAVLEAGIHSLIWNSRNDDEQEVASGVYIYELTWENQKQRSRMNLLK